MGIYSDAMKKISTWEFSKNQPKPDMTVVAKIERVQPFVVGVKPNGDFIWEGQSMPKWQMEMIRVAVNIWSAFYTRWGEVMNHQYTDREFRPQDNTFYPVERRSQKKLTEMRYQYPRNKKITRKVVGD